MKPTRPVQREARIHGGAPRQEALWINPAADEAHRNGAPLFAGAAV